MDGIIFEPIARWRNTVHIVNTRTKKPICQDEPKEDWDGVLENITVGYDSLEKGLHQWCDPCVAFVQKSVGQHV